MRNVSIHNIFSITCRITLPALPIVLLGFVAGYALSWWTIAPIAFVFAAFNKKYSPVSGFLICFFAGFVLWSVYAIYLNYDNEDVLTERIGVMLAGGSNGMSATALMLLTGMIGGLAAGLGGITGVYARNLKNGR